MHDAMDMFNIEISPDAAVSCHNNFMVVSPCSLYLSNCMSFLQAEIPLAWSCMSLLLILCNCCEKSYRSYNQVNTVLVSNFCTYVLYTYIHHRKEMLSFYIILHYNNIVIDVLLI